MISPAAIRVARRFTAKSSLPEWSEVVKDIQAFNHFYEGAKKLLRGNPTREDRKALAKYQSSNNWPHDADALSIWLDTNFPKEFIKAASMGFKLAQQVYAIIHLIEIDPKEVKEFLDKLERFTDAINSMVAKVYPARFTYQGFKVYNDKRLAEPLVKGCLDGVDFAVALFKKRGLSKGLTDAVKAIDLVWERGETWAGLYHVAASIITINATAVGSSFKRLWTNWVQEIFVHEFGHHIEKHLPKEAWKVWEGAWDEANAAKEKLGEKTSVTGADRLKFFNMLRYLQWDLAAAAKKYKGLDKLKLGAWLRNPWTGTPLITPKQFRLTKRGQYMFTFFRDPEGVYRDELGYPPEGEDPERDESLRQMLTNRLNRFHKALGVDKGSLGYSTPIPKDIAEEMREEDKTVDEALNKLELPSDYARTNPAEDFAESFLAFMVNPGALSKQSMFRMKQVLSLAGLYGGSVMRLAQRVAQRYIEAGYLNVGDVILYGKFKNARGRIISFGKNDKGDPTMEVQPIDKDGKAKKGKPKTITMLKVRKVPKKG